MVGDTAFDIEMAHAAGARAIGVAWGYHPPAELVQAGADAMISDFSELVPTLERLWRKAPLAERLAAT
jgi:phosphoglycolate phosphatase